MKKNLAVSVILFLFFGVLTAQNTKKNETVQTEVKTNIKHEPAQDSGKSLNKEKIKISQQTAKEPEPEEGKVLIDTATSEEESGQKFVKRQDVDSEGILSHHTNIPAFFGQLKGILLEGGRNILVFENDAGVLTLVQISITQNNKITCKTIGNIYRTTEE